MKKQGIKNLMPGVTLMVGSLLIGIAQSKADAMFVESAKTDF